MQSSLRQEFQKAYSSRILTLQKFYEQKHSSLQRTLEDSYLKVLSNDLLKTMLDDENTSFYVKDMIGELFSQVVAQERQLVIEDLGITISRIKGDLVLSEQTIKRFKVEIDRLNNLLSMKEEEFDKTKTNYQNRSTKLISQEETIKEQLQRALEEKEGQIRELKDELKYVCEELNGYKLDLTERDEKLRNVERSERELVDTTREFGNVKRELELEIKELELQVLRVNKEKSSQDELRSGVIKMLQNKLKQVQSNSKEIQDTLKQQFNNKSLSYKKKIEQHKFRVSEVLTKNSILEKKLQFSNQNILDLESKLTSLLQQNQRSLSEYRSIRDRERIELEKKFEHQLRQFQSHYQRLLQSKIQEIEEEAVNHLNSMKECEYQYQQILERKAEEYQNSYVSRKEHERLMREKQEVIERQIMGIHDKELDGKELEFRVTMEKDKRERVEREMEYVKNKLGEYDNVFKEEKMRRKGLESEKDGLKSEVKRYKKLIGDNEEKMKLILKDLDDRISKQQKTKTRCESLENELRLSQQTLTETTARLTTLVSESQQQATLLTDLSQTSSTLQNQNQLLTDQNIFLQSKLTSITHSLTSTSSNLSSTESQLQQLTLSIQTLTLQNTQLFSQIQSLQTKQLQQSQTLKLSMNEMTQKYTEFKEIARKLETELKGKDELIEELSGVNEGMRKKSRRVGEMVRGLWRDVSQMGKWMAAVKEMIAGDRKVWGKQMEIMMNGLWGKVEETLKQKQREFDNEKQNIKQTFKNEFDLLIKANRQNLLLLSQCNQSQSESFKAQILSLQNLLSQLASESSLLSQSLASTKSTSETALHNTSAQLSNLSTQYTLLQTQYQTLKSSYKTLITQHQSLQQTYRNCSRSLSEKQEIIKENKNEIALMEKQLGDVLGQNDLLKERKTRLQGEINEMRSIVSKAAKGSESEGIKMARVLDVETKQLTKRVEMLKKMGGYSAGKQALRG